MREDLCCNFPNYHPLIYIKNKKSHTHKRMGRIIVVPPKFRIILIQNYSLFPLTQDYGLDTNAKLKVQHLPLSLSGPFVSIVAIGLTPSPTRFWPYAVLLPLHWFILYKLYYTPKIFILILFPQYNEVFFWFPYKFYQYIPQQHQWQEVASLRLPKLKQLLKSNLTLCCQ